MLDLKMLDNTNRLLITVPLRPVQGDRFQPTGFPSLGAATYQTKDGQRLLVESAQSMANRLETACWDGSKNTPVSALDGISHVTVTRKDAFLTDTMLEAHRLSSPYLIKNSDRGFLDPFLGYLRESLGKEVVDDNQGMFSRSALARVVLKYDVGSLIHGVFFSQKEVVLTPGGKGSSIAGGRLRIARALSTFIEASGVKVAASGGVKNDYVNPSGEAKNGFGNVPFSRDEFVAERIDCHINLDLAQIRGYGLEQKVERLLILLALHRVRKLLDGDLRLRTACDLEPLDRENIVASRPEGFKLPLLEELDAVKTAISNCKELMTHTTVTFEDELKKGKDTEKIADVTADEETEIEEPSDD
jgi:CRISPR-associated protein Csb1